MDKKNNKLNFKEDPFLSWMTKQDINGNTVSPVEKKIKEFQEEQESAWPFVATNLNMIDYQYPFQTSFLSSSANL